MKERKPRKDGRYMINVSFTENETYLLEFADSQGSFTSYVKRLIHEDMRRYESNNTLDLLLKRSDLVKLLTENNELTATIQEPEQVGEKEKEPEIDEAALNEMLELE